MPVCEKALRQRQHAEAAGRIYRQRRRLAERSIPSRPGTEGNLTPEQAQKMMNDWKTKQTALLLDPDGKAGRAYGAQEHAAHVRHQSGRQNHLRRRDRQQSFAESSRHSELDQLRESRAR